MAPRWLREGSEIAPFRFILLLPLFSSRQTCSLYIDAVATCFVKFTWNPNHHSRHLQGTSRVQVEPNWAHLHLFLELTT